MTFIQKNIATAVLFTACITGVFASEGMYCKTSEKSTSLVAASGNNSWPSNEEYQCGDGSKKKLKDLYAAGWKLISFQPIKNESQGTTIVLMFFEKQ